MQRESLFYTQLLIVSCLRNSDMKPGIETGLVVVVVVVTFRVQKLSNPVKAGPPTSGLVVTRCKNSQGIQGSLQIRICFPSPTLQMTPFFSRFKPCIIACQVDEGLEQNVVSSKCPLG